MANIFKRVSGFFDRIWNSGDYVHKTNTVQINVTEPAALEDAKSGTSLIKAVVAKIFPPEFTKRIERYFYPRNYEFEYPDAKFETVKKAIKVESYLRRAKDRYIELIWKNGFEFIGKNKTAVNYIKRRFKEIAAVTEKPTKIFFEEIAEQLIPYYNVFIVKIRKQSHSSGNPRKYFGKTVQPVAGYFVVSVNDMVAEIDQETKILKKWYFKNSVLDELIEYDYRDVVHMTIAREAGKIWGDPPIFAILDDVRALRRMEENVEILVFQHTIPLFHYTVGTENKPALVGEVDSVKSEVENMLTQGMVVTPERHAIEAVGAQREALQVKDYLEYFKARILTGMGQSTISIGETGGASRATASVLSKSVLDSTVRFKNTLTTYINEFMINELLQEGGFDVFNDNNKVELFIPEIDLEDKIKKEVHAESLWLSNLLTEDEARKELGRDPFSESDREKTYFELIVKPKTIMQASDEPWILTYGTPAQKAAVTAATLAAKAGTGASAGQTGKNSRAALANKRVPRNQFGTQKGPTQRTGGDAIMNTDSIGDQVFDSLLQTYIQVFSDQYDAAQEDVYQMIDENSFTSCKMSINISKQIVAEHGSQFIIETYKSGLGKAGYSDSVTIDADLKFLHAQHLESVTKFFDDILDRIDASDKTKGTVISIFESQRYRIGFLIDWHIKKAYWLGIASGRKSLGNTSINIISESKDVDDICLKNVGKLDLDLLYMYKIPPYHSNCNCKLSWDEKTV